MPEVSKIDDKTDKVDVKLGQKKTIHDTYIPLVTENIKREDGKKVILNV